MTSMTSETRALLDTLRAAGDKASTDAAGLIEWLIDMGEQYRHELSEARAQAESYRASADDAAAVLCRIGDHLGRLAEFTEGCIADDPFPTSTEAADREQ